MPYFSDEALAEMKQKRRMTSFKQRELVEVFLSRPYRSEVAKEQAHHGVGRRLSSLAHSLERVFAILPPENERVPDKETRIEADVFIQAFVFNLFGFLENLAHIWVAERNIRGENDRPLPISHIGLRPENETVRATFSREAQAELAALDEWFANLKAFRDNLAHRIPLYVIPFIVLPKDEQAYNGLYADEMEAVRQGNLRLAVNIEKRRKALKHFRPWMKHSTNDPAPPVVFHPQMLADFATAEKIALLILGELDRPMP
jgi:hypothetical protein